MVKKHKVIIVLLVLALILTVGAAAFFWLKIEQFEPEVYYYVPPEISFVYTSEETAGYGFEEYIKDKIMVERLRLIKEKKSFVDVDLRSMKLVLYEEGEVFKIFDIQSKGKEGSWSETAPGAYFVGDKVLKHFSTIARVWMPYAVQFYGNFFIHGWPYTRSGHDLALGPSGGCIRLLTADAAVVYEFTERGMPVLVFDEKTSSPLSALLSLDGESVPPELSGNSAMVADLVTGEIVLSKEIHSEFFTDVAARGMLALAASEIVSLEKRIIARSWMTEKVKEGVIVYGRSYRLQDLIGLLLERSSQEAALVLSRFVNPEYFLAAMNAKAGAIGMHNTRFVDITGSSQENITTLFDMARMMRYIKDYRGFLFDVSSQWSGKGEGNKETVFKIFETGDRAIFIGIANSENAQADLEKIIVWLGNDLGLK